MREDWRLNGYRVWSRAWATEEGCCRLLSEVVPPPSRCPSCGAGGKWWRWQGAARSHFDCKTCRYRVRLRTLTVFGNSRTPLPLCFEALWHVATSARGLSVTQLQALLKPKAAAGGRSLDSKTTRWLLSLAHSWAVQPLWRGFMFQVASNQRLGFQNRGLFKGSRVLFLDNGLTLAGWRQSRADNRLGYERLNKGKWETKYEQAYRYFRAKMRRLLRSGLDRQEAWAELERNGVLAKLVSDYFCKYSDLQREAELVQP